MVQLQLQSLLLLFLLCFDSLLSYFNQLGQFQISLRQQRLIWVLEGCAIERIRSCRVRLSLFRRLLVSIGIVMRVGAVNFLEVQRWNVHFSDWASSVVLVGRVVKGGWFLGIGSLKVLSVKETSHPFLDRDRSLVLSISLLAMLVGFWFVVDCGGVLRRWPMLCRVVVRGVATRLKWFEIVGTLSLAIICRLVEWVYLQASALLLSGRRTYLRF